MYGVPPSPSPLPLLRLSPSPSFLSFPVPWPLGIGPVGKVDPGFVNYVGRPPAFQELTGPGWPGPATRASPSPLMGEVRPLRLLPRPDLFFLPPPLCFVLRWGGGGPPQVLGISPHLLVQTAHEGRARLLGGWPPLPFWLGSCPYLPDPSLHTVCLGRTLLGGSSFPVLISCSSPLPSASSYGGGGGGSSSGLWDFPPSDGSDCA